MKKVVQLFFFALVVTSLLGCGSSKSTTENSNVLPREKTLYLVGFQWGGPSSFNPLNDWPSWPVRPEFNLMYEPLTTYNSLNGDIEPLIGRLLEKTPDYVTVAVNPAARWSDGAPLTAKDVKFSYEMGKRFHNLPTAYVNGFLGDVKIDTIETFDTTVTVGEDSVSVTSVDTITEERVKFFVDKKDRNNPMVLVDLLSSIPIYPEHIFEPKLQAASGDVGDLQELPMDKAEDHVISGPYNLYDYSNEKVIVKRRDNYWGNDALYNGKKAAPEFIVHPIYKTNSAASSALKHGLLDLSANFMPRIWLKKSRGVHTWYNHSPYYVPGSIPMFIINTEKKPMDDKRFRRAMAMAIDYNKVGNLAASGYTPDINSGLILPFSDEAKYYEQSEVDSHGASALNIPAAKKILKEAGYTSHFNQKGELEYSTGPNGDTLPTLFIMCPSGWSDFEAVIKLAVKSMRTAGIDVREGFVDESKYEPARETGSFDIIMDTPSAKLSSSMPWARFESVMSSAKWRPCGDKMKENIGRFNQPGSANFIPEIDSLLALIPLMVDSAQLADAYRTLNRIYMEEQPTIPVQYKPEEFYQFNNTHWTNFATEENPYAPPHVLTAGSARKMLWEIKLAESKEAK